jgi:DNA mismatch endonuclease (patch repair protein)
MKICKCGCGETIKSGKTTQGTDRIFVIGHNRRGANLTQEHIKRFGGANKGRKHSEETKEKIKEKRKLQVITEEHKRKTSVSMMGHIGVKHTPETIEKIKQARLQQVLPTKDTSIEVALQNELNKRGIKFEKHYPIQGQPDIFITPNICVFADGDYWHNYPSGRDKDKRITQELQNKGFKVLRFWERDINKNIEKCICQIEAQI